MVSMMVGGSTHGSLGEAFSEYSSDSIILFLLVNFERLSERFCLGRAIFPLQITISVLGHAFEVFQMRPEKKIMLLK